MTTTTKRLLMCYPVVIGLDLFARAVGGAEFTDSERVQLPAICWGLLGVAAALTYVLFRLMASRKRRGS